MNAIQPEGVEDGHHQRKKRKVWLVTSANQEGMEIRRESKWGINQAKKDSGSTMKMTKKGHPS
jgi:hypothetical protein